MARPVVSLKPSYNSIVRGCPGIPETLPRIECELRIQSDDGRPTVIEKIEVSLSTTEVLNASGPSFKSKSKLERETVHYEKTIRLSNKKVLGIDIPFTIALPEHIKETNYNKFGYTFTEYKCRVSYVTGNERSSGNDNIFATEVFSTLVNIEKYNLLASPRIFPPLRKKAYSPDNKFQVKYCIRNTCLSTEDVLHLELEIKPNISRAYGSHSQKLFNKKLKLKSIALELKEYLEVYDSHVDGRENTLGSSVTHFNTMVTEKGIALTSDIDICTKIKLFDEFKKLLNDSTSIYQMPYNEPDLGTPTPNVVILKSKCDKIEDLQYHCSITTRGNLFSVIHGLTIKFKISNGKDFEINQPLDISAWPTADVGIVEQIIANEKEIANHARSFYSMYGGIKRNRRTGSVEYPPLPPVVYAVHKRTLADLGIIYNTSYKQPQRIPIIE